MTAIQFKHAGRSYTVSPGEHFAARREAGFRDTPEAALWTLVAEVEAGRSWREAVAERYAKARPWLHRIITDPSRTAFFGEVLPAGAGPVLDIGSGWGQICRPLASQRPVVAVEPVAERMAFIRAAATQDGVAQKMVFLGTDYLELEFESTFEAVCAIGVLEWTGAFRHDADPQGLQRDFLRQIRRDLAPGGCLVLGIENRIGLKYLLGCPDDHIGVPHIACLPAPLARKRWKESTGAELRSFTYTRVELEQMLRAAGFSEIRFWGAFPDYKLPQRIVPLDPTGDALHGWLQNDPPPVEHNGYDGSPLPPAMAEALCAQYRTLALEGIAAGFVPSFFVRAS